MLSCSHLGKRTAHILEEDAPPKKRRKKGTLAGDEERCGLPGDEEGCQIADRVVNDTVKKTWKRRREAEDTVQRLKVRDWMRGMSFLSELTPHTLVHPPP